MASLDLGQGGIIPDIINDRGINDPAMLRLINFKIYALHGVDQQRASRTISSDGTSLVYSIDSPSSIYFTGLDIDFFNLSTSLLTRPA